MFNPFKIIIDEIKDWKRFIKQISDGNITWKFNRKEILGAMNPFKNKWVITSLLIAILVWMSGFQIGVTKQAIVCEEYIYEEFLDEGKCCEINIHDENNEFNELFPMKEENSNITLSIT